MVVSRLDKSIFDILMMTNDSKPFVEARENLFAFYIRKRKKKEMFIDINFHRFGILNLHIFQAKILK